MIDYEEDWTISLLWKHEGSVLLRASFFAIPAVVASVLLLYLDEWYPGQREDFGLLELRSSQLWNATTLVFGILLGFRTKQALARFWEGTGLLHQMRGEWFDTVSNCVTFSISAKATKEREVNNFRHAIVRLMSLAHGAALEEIAGNQVQVDTIDILGLDDLTLKHIKECKEVWNFNKVEVILHMVQSLITKAHDDGVLKIPPPILSRVYQTISRGFVNLLNAKKITDTRFPFPYAQLMSMMLFLITLMTPLIVTSVVFSKVLAAMLTFVPIVGMASLNLVATELENPFGTDANDLPLYHFQSEMNNCLLMLLHSGTDIVPTVRPDCLQDFETLYKESTTDENDSKSTSDCEDNVNLPRRKTRLSHLSSPASSSARRTVETIGGKSRPSVFTVRSKVESEADSMAGSLDESKQNEMRATTASADSVEVRPAGNVRIASIKEASNSVELGKEVTQVPTVSDGLGTTTSEVGLQQAPASTHTADSPQPTRTMRFPALARPLSTNPGQPCENDLLVKNSIDELKSTMQRWMELTEKQVTEMNSNSGALRSLSDALSAFEARRYSGWENALPGV